MTLDDRLRSTLRADAQTIDVAGAGPEAVMATARRRARRRRAGSSLVALALVAGVGTFAYTLTDDDPVTDNIEATGAEQLDNDDPATTPDGAAEDTGTEDATQVQELPDTTADETLEETEADLAETSPLGLAAVNGLAQADDGLVAWGPANGAVVWFSTDGSSWSALSPAHPDPQAWVGDVATDGETIWAMGGITTDDAGAEMTEPWVASTTDRVTWTQHTLDLPPDVETPITVSTYSLYDLDAGPAGVIITGEHRLDYRVDELLGDRENAEIQLGDSAGNLERVLVVDNATGDVLEEYDLTDYGVGDAELALLDRGAEPILQVLIDDAFASRSDTPGAATFVKVAAGADGFVGAAHSNDFNTMVLWTSPDGDTWTQLPVDVNGENPQPMLGSIGDRTLTVTNEGPLLTTQVSTSETGDWVETRLDQLLDGDHGDHLITAAGFSEQGFAAIVVGLDQVAESDAPSSSPAATDQSVVVPADGIIGYTARVDLDAGLITLLAPDGSTLASFPSWLVADPAETPGPGESLPAGVERIGGGVAWVVDGEAVAEFGRVSAAIDAMFADATLGTAERAPDLRTHYLVATRDGESWTVEPLRNLLDPDADSVDALVVRADGVVLATLNPVDGTSFVNFPLPG